MREAGGDPPRMHRSAPGRLAGEPVGTRNGPGETGGPALASRGVGSRADGGPGTMRRSWQ